MLALAAFITIVPAAATAQVDAIPSRLAEIELERSRICVGTLAGIAVLDQTLEPLVRRGTRLRQIGEAVALEDRRGLEPFDGTDPTEGMVRDWFTTDAALAQRYLTTEDEQLQAERQAGRETIKNLVAQALTSLQAQADSVLTANADLIQSAGPCDGAIFVRSAVQDACADASGAICDQAGLPAGEAADFRFVDAGESVWEIQESRPWTVPGPLQPNADGQLGGGRTIGYARVGNVAVSLSFSPLFVNREDASAEELAGYEAINDSIGLTFDHPDLAVAPALSLRAALPEPLGTETRYVVHFGEITAPDVLWTGAAGSGVSIEAAIPLAAAHVARLRAGDPIMLTAVGGESGDQTEYSILVGNVNQAPAATVLINYMTSQMAADLGRIMQPRG
jgi:hypothetical protein